MLKQAVFLVGGRGSRLGALTDSTPKPFITVAGRPFLAYLMDNAIRHGLHDIILLAGYLADQLQQAWGPGSAAHQALAAEGVNIRVVAEPEAAGTAGALLHARDWLDDQFLLANGDSFFDFNWLDLLTLDAPAHAIARIGLRRVPDGSRYGRVMLDGDRVTAFEPRGLAEETLINGGVYLLGREILTYVDRTPLSIEQDVFPRLAAEGRIFGRAHDGFFIDIGVPEDLARADRTITAATTRPAAFLDRDGVLNHDHGYIHRAADFEWIPGAKEAIRSLNDRGYYVFVVTNQGGVAHGYYDEKAVAALHDWMQRELQPLGAHIDRFEYCPHHPEGRIAAYVRACDRRKPGPGMLRDCMARWPVDKARSFLIGDKPSDIEAAQAVGIAGHLFTGEDLLAFLDNAIFD
jgi:D-glycero-D-manno-heptose 1,7-bisphosphate phosphatase